MRKNKGCGCILYIFFLLCICYFAFSVLEILFLLFSVFSLIYYIVYITKAKINSRKKSFSSKPIIKKTEDNNSKMTKEEIEQYAVMCNAYLEHKQEMDEYEKYFNINEK